MTGDMKRLPGTNLPKSWARWHQGPVLSYLLKRLMGKRQAQNKTLDCSLLFIFEELIKTDTEMDE